MPIYPGLIVSSLPALVAHAQGSHFIEHQSSTNANVPMFITSAEGNYSGPTYFDINIAHPTDAVIPIGISSVTVKMVSEGGVEPSLPGNGVVIAEVIRG